MLFGLCGVATADVKVDWARGLVIASGVGVADRHAPSPAVARGTARRGAEDAAKAALAAAIVELPSASGQKVGAAATGALASVVTLEAEPDTDGSWRVSLAVPIEAVRQRLAGPRTVAIEGDRALPVVIVDGVTAKPAVGWKIGGTAGAALWVKSVPPWAKDAPHVKATGAKAGEIAATLPAEAGAPTLFLIVTP